MKTIGVLGIQGAIEKHLESVVAIGCKGLWVKTAADLKKIDGIILPGGESTSIGKQLEWFGMMNPLREAIAQGLPAFGTCAGMILLAKDIEACTQARIGLMDITVRRNAYGSQLDSFITDLQVKGIQGKIPAVFIRAPRIEKCGRNVEILASHKDHPVLVRQKNMMAASFHPELTEDTRLHACFGQML